MLQNKIQYLWTQDQIFVESKQGLFDTKFYVLYTKAWFYLSHCLFFFFFHATVFHWEPTPQDGSEHGFWVENAQNRASFQHDEMHGLVIYITYLKFTIIIYIERKIFGSSWGLNKKMTVERHSECTQIVTTMVPTGCGWRNCLIKTV